MADVDACFNTVESAETPLQLNIAAGEINSLDVLITEVLKNIEEEKNSGRKFSPSPSRIVAYLVRLQAVSPSPEATRHSESRIEI